jgi:hypothetical protein
METIVPHFSHFTSSAMSSTSDSAFFSGMFWMAVGAALMLAPQFGQLLKSPTTG